MGQTHQPGFVSSLKSHPDAGELPFQQDQGGHNVGLADISHDDDVSFRDVLE